MELKWPSITEGSRGSTDSAAAAAEPAECCCCPEASPPPAPPPPVAAGAAAGAAPAAAAPAPTPAATSTTNRSPNLSATMAYAPSRLNAPELGFLGTFLCRCGYGRDAVRACSARREGWRRSVEAFGIDRTAKQQQGPVGCQPRLPGCTRNGGAANEQAATANGAPPTVHTQMPACCPPPPPPPRTLPHALFRLRPSRPPPPLVPCPILPQHAALKPKPSSPTHHAATQVQRCVSHSRSSLSSAPVMR